MKGTVYLSYSGRNCEAVLQVMEGLIAKGHGFVCDCMLQDKAPVGERAQTAIRQAALVVAVITEDAVSCEYMRKELECAVQAGIRILPVVVGNAVLPTYFERSPEMGLYHVSEYPTKEEMAAVMESVAGLTGDTI